MIVIVKTFVVLIAICVILGLMLHLENPPERPSLASANRRLRAFEQRQLVVVEAQVRTTSSQPAAAASVATNKKKHNSMVFLKTHKSGSTTLIGTFQKYAYLNDLLVMVPSIGNAMYDWPLEFKPNIKNIPAPDNKRFDMLLNHIIFNKTSIAPLMKPDAKYFTILREPLAHLRSAFEYFGINEDKRLGKGKEALEKFLSDPAKHDVMPSWMKAVVPYATNRVNSLTRNVQSADLGLMYKDFFNSSRVSEFISGTLQDFDLIFILERLNESLILFRRIMNWDMQDVLFVVKNWNPNRFKVSELSEQAKNAAYAWSSVDDQLYTAANKWLDELLTKEKDIHQEIEVFKIVHQNITDFCIRERQTTDTITIAASQWNNQFVVDNRYCVLLQLDERDLTLLFKCSQKPGHRECQPPSDKRIDQIKAMIEGRQPYKFLPATTIKPRKMASVI